MKLKLFWIMLVLAVSAIASAGTLVVTSPTEGAFLGTNNTLRFQITGATVEVTIGVDIDSGAGVTHIEQRFTPDGDGKINDSIPLNFSASSPEGPYTITVTATEPGNTYNTVVLHVTVDVTKPKFFDLNPINNSFVKGPNVPIVVKVIDANFKEYRVQINGQDIPGNTGTSLDANSSFTVNWNTNGILQDGAQTILITTKDQANNESTSSLTVTLDRIAPVTTIQFPRSDTNVRPRSDVSVVVDVADASSSSVSVTGVDVVIRDMNNNLILRVPRLSFQAQGSTTVRWTGRIKKTVTLPRDFKVVATTVDKAGNVGVPQTTVAHVG